MGAEFAGDDERSDKCTAITHSQLLSPESVINPTSYKKREITESELVRLGSVTGARLLTRGLNQEGARNQRRWCDRQGTPGQPGAQAPSQAPR